MEDPNYEKQVVISGSLSLGFEVYGPFDSEAIARAFIDDNIDRLEEHIEVISIQSPQDAIEEWNNS